MSVPKQKETVSPLSLHSPHEIGSLLKHTREELGYTVEDISHNIKIRHELIRALEVGSLDLFPGKVYAIGFMRTYAGFLGLDADYIITSLKTCPEFYLIDQAYSSEPDEIQKKSKKIPFLDYILSVILLFFFSIMIYTMVQDKSSPIEKQEQTHEQETASPSDTQDHADA